MMINASSFLQSTTRRLPLHVLLILSRKSRSLCYPSCYNNSRRHQKAIPFCIPEVSVDVNQNSLVLINGLQKLYKGINLVSSSETHRTSYTQNATHIPPTLCQAHTQYIVNVIHLMIIIMSQYIYFHIQKHMYIEPLVWGNPSWHINSTYHIIPQGHNTPDIQSNRPYSSCGRHPFADPVVVARTRC